MERSIRQSKSPTAMPRIPTTSSGFSNRTTIGPCFIGFESFNSKLKYDCTTRNDNKRCSPRRRERRSKESKKFKADISRPTGTQQKVCLRIPMEEKKAVGRDA